MKTALLFSGQGSQYPAMGRDFFENYAEYRAVFESAAKIFGRDLNRQSLELDEAALSDTAVAQPLIYCMSVGIFKSVGHLLGEIFCVGGHSLGEYAALTAAGVFELDTGLEIIKIRSEIMKQASDSLSGAMCAIMSSDREIIAEVCGQAGGFVEPVNFNSLAQTVIAGETAAVKKAAELFAEKQIKAVMLSSPCAFHSLMMRPAAEKFKTALAGFDFAAPKTPFYSNLDGKERKDIDSAYLESHMTSPVRFTDQLAEMHRAGVGRFIEIGPSRVVSGLVKRTLKDVEIYNIEDAKSLDKTLAAIK